MITITFLGHAGFLVTDGTHTVAIDPFLTGNPVAKRDAKAVSCQSVALTHGHADHMGDAFAIATANDATVFAPFEICEHFGEQGLERVEPMGPGGRVDTSFGYVALTPAIHSSSIEGKYMGMPCGVVLNMGGVTMYHCGDTTLFSDMALIGEIYQPDIAMVPIGDRFTMGPKLAIRAVELIRPKIAIPIHYNTWPLIAQDPGEFAPPDVDVWIMDPEDQRTAG